MEEQRKNPKKSGVFEFCRICKLNHSDGRRHVYFPKHKTKLLYVLSRFTDKLSDVKYFLNCPSFFRPEHASPNRMWCTFCDVDISEQGSLFACEKIIKHLASVEHLENLKYFLRRYGGNDHLDSLRVTSADLNKWEVQCKSLKSSATSLDKAFVGPLNVQSKDIHHELNSLEKVSHYSNHSFVSNVSYNVLPLQCYTNERCQVSPSQSIFDQGGKEAAYQCSTGRVVQVSDRKDTSIHGLLSQSLTSIPRSLIEGPVPNVHSGAPPPWLENNEVEFIFGACRSSDMQSHLARVNQSQRTSKLNPKRVGAVWAERRKAELEKEKRGEMVSSRYHNDWLPNFGSVWQCGTRKESKKAFEREKSKLKVKTTSDRPIKIMPYISKRMMEATRSGN